jgi:integrase
VKRTMLSRVEAYLELRRSLGYRLRSEGVLLINFAHYADRSRHQGPLTQQLALRWATSSKTAGPCFRARRLEIVRVFAQYLLAFEPATELPSRHVLGPARRRRAPHLYNAAELCLLLARAGKLGQGLRPLSYQTLIGLMACTGLRISEVLGMSVRDVDLEQGVLTLRESKYPHTRLVPLHPTALPPLRRYARQRQKAFPNAQHFFVSSRGRRFACVTVRTVFVALSEGINPAPGWRRVRLHDLRHTFACRVLLRWQRSKQGVGSRLLVLSRYLGHLRVRDTFWYLNAFPELLSEAARRFQPPPL